MSDDLTIEGEKPKDDPLWGRRDEPEGRFVLRQDGHAVKAKTFHYYKDCGSVVLIHTSSGDTHLINLDTLGEEDSTGDLVVEMLGLRLCSVCNNRERDRSAYEVLAREINHLVLAEVKGIAAEDPADLIDPGLWAERLLTVLDEGFSVKKRKP